ncbi:hypothetical protein AFCDBAGC_1955 [Methylobacterium cerastii]|uniref:DUF4258 domain-containing protein n=1 Tax=Methylobacterium cerastii TaxID=932741 RepID=A0ABQ4QGR7_9HYPH|nr:hypothetical protein [Methylobacterium cerastii]GJD44092.1 hypothetical protein AFCDBAGC_1955 [Methylobacterium cerastii]
MPHIPVNTRFTAHADRRAQQRGKRRDALDLVYRAGDRERPAGRNRRAVSLTSRACRDLVGEGTPPELVDRASRIELVVSENDGFVITILNRR